MLRKLVEAALTVLRAPFRVLDVVFGSTKKMEELNESLLTSIDSLVADNTRLVTKNADLVTKNGLLRSYVASLEQDLADSNTACDTLVDTLIKRNQEITVLKNRFKP